MRFVKLDKGDFVGSAQTKASDEQKLPEVCEYLVIETYASIDGNGSEAVAVDGQPVGLLSSVTYRHSVGKILGFAYLKPEAAVPRTDVEVMLLGALRLEKVLADAADDPDNLRPRTDA